MPGIIGKKVGMTNIFVEENQKMVACTLVEATPNVVTQLKTVEKDGYSAVQLGAGERKEKNTPAPMKGHFKKAGSSPKHILREFDGFEGLGLGDEVNVSLFSEGDVVSVTGTSKGKGFQGVVKRHGFAGVGGRTHGQHNRGRHPGSSGAGSNPSRVFPGLRMAGRMGGDRVKMDNLRILKVIAEKNLIVVSGSVPGAYGSYVILEK